jgi:D12 class N6 adenine-specific DNA methyltransferase
MLTALQKWPTPYFGGKRDAAPAIWEALGDVAHFVDPFCGSCAVLLERPHPCNRPYSSETVNDADGFLVNALRSMQWHPQATAEAASWPVSEADLHARHLALLRWEQEHDLEHLMGDPHWCNPEVAGWWLWGLCCWIGSGWCGGDGPWIVDTTSGRIVRRSDATAGVWRQRPEVNCNGSGVHHAGTREPGVCRDTPPSTDIHDDWRAMVDADYAATDGFHPMTMPELRRWFAYLSARLHHVRILNGDWRRAVTDGVLKTLGIRTDKGVAGVFLDPPYTSTERDSRLYRKDNKTGENIAAAVRTWCLVHSDDPALRIVLAGFAGEGHEVLEEHGWFVKAWFKDGHLKGGMGHEHQQHRERLWCSPNCIRPVTTAQLSMW